MVVMVLPLRSMVRLLLNAMSALTSLFESRVIVDPAAAFETTVEKVVPVAYMVTVPPGSVTLNAAFSSSSANAVRVIPVTMSAKTTTAASNVSKRVLFLIMDSSLYVYILIYAWVCNYYTK